jgi:NADH-quinone oxidoreductase subunit L
MTPTAMNSKPRSQASKGLTWGALVALLAVGAVAAGFVFAPWFIGDYEHDFWRGAITNLQHHTALDARHHVPDWVWFAPGTVMLIGFATAWYFYIDHPELPARMAARQGPLYLFLYNKWYFDEIYDLLFGVP